MDTFFVDGNLVDCLKRTISPVRMTIQAGKIKSIDPTESSNIDFSLPFIVPGFIDAHCHFLGLGLQQQKVDFSSF